MDNNQNKDTFTYTYSAKEKKEIEKIRSKYVPDENDKMEQLRRLDAGVTKKGTIWSLIIGIIGSLILGVGMSCAMLWNMYIVGSGIGILGIALVALAYPIYTAITKKERAKIAPEIIRLTDELMK